MNFDWLLRGIFGSRAKGAETTQAAPDRNRIRADASHFIIPVTKLMEIGTDVPLYASEIEKFNDGRLTLQQSLGRKIVKIGSILERCGKERGGSDYHNFRPLAISMRHLGNAVYEADGPDVRIDRPHIDLIENWFPLFLDAESFLNDFSPPDRSGVQNLREDRPSLIYSQNRIFSPLDGIEGDPEELSAGIKIFREGFKNLLSEISAARNFASAAPGRNFDPG